MLNAQLPARRRAAVALVVLAASAAFGVADAGAADPNGTDNTNLAAGTSLGRPLDPGRLPPAGADVRVNRARVATKLPRLHGAHAHRAATA